MQVEIIINMSGFKNLITTLIGKNVLLRISSALAPHNSATAGFLHV